MKRSLRTPKLTSIAASGCEICDVIAELNLPAETHNMFTCAKQKQVGAGWRATQWNASSIPEDHCEICDVIAELNLPAEAHDTFTCAQQKRSEEHGVLSLVVAQAHISRGDIGVLCAQGF